MKPSVIAIVIPCFNEEAVLPNTLPRFKACLARMQQAGKAAAESFILLVDDGSTDSTWHLIRQAADKDACVRGISLSRNRGHQNALLAGLMDVCGHVDACISIDCDGQDDIDAMERMVDEFRQGIDIVYGVRSSRATDSLFKRLTAEAFYRLMNALGVESVFNHADYRLMSARALEALSQFKEVNLYLRGMVPMVGFTSTAVYYERHERVAGTGHYPLSKMLGLAVDGITSLSVKPIRLITAFGFIVSIVSFIGVIWAIAVSLTGQSIAGWGSTVSILCFIGGIQLVSLGVIGEYIGKIYLETKGRPRFIIRDRTDTDPKR